MASGRARCTRKLRNWVVEQVESGQFPGVCWDDTAKTMFRIPWKHAGKQDFREDQDAAFFKAWAIFKGKYKEGDTGGPAVWKTRLRCALNKSTEFEEVPKRGRMDVAEPYKVYRLLPPGTFSGQPGTQKSPSKRQHSSVSSERKEEEGAMQNCTLSPSVLQESLNNEEEEASGGALHSDIGSSSSSSPEPQEGTDTTEAPFQGDQRSLEFLLPPEPDLAKYFQGLGPPPKFQVTLNFWEESRGPSHTPQNLITVKMEQAFARYLLEETPEQQAAILSLV
ncbi:interferon regulatory factor 9 isoform X3 [Macaca fascicularis]|uniref:interferon regulatory factor 9 isoform X3 n=1 Tax=Macaca fascicularis TaxID=9541 RepID=UPI003D15ADDA